MFQGDKMFQYPQFEYYLHDKNITTDVHNAFTFRSTIAQRLRLTKVNFGMFGPRT